MKTFTEVIVGLILIVMILFAYGIPPVKTINQRQITLKTKDAYILSESEGQGIQDFIGHYVNYTLYLYDYSSGELIGIGYHKIVFDSYVEHDEILIKIEGRDPWGNFYNSSAVVNVTDRRVESGDLYLWWIHVDVIFCPHWVETNVSLGSKIKLFSYDDAIIYATQILILDDSLFDCWAAGVSTEPHFVYLCQSWFEETSGLLVKMHYIEYLSHIADLVLADTDIPIERCGSLNGPYYYSFEIEYWILEIKTHRPIRLISK